MTEILVVETLTASPGKKNVLKKALIELASISRKADGCLQYDLFDRAGDEVCIIMRFVSEQTLREHEHSSYVADFVARHEHVSFCDFSVQEWTSF